jgi:transglycosylase-like protein with SLT domain
MTVLLAGLLTVAAATGKPMEPETPEPRIEVTTETQEAAAEAGVDPIDLLGAQVTTGLGPREYLWKVGELVPVPVLSPLTGRVACIIWVESHGNPSAVNRYSGASGLGQFLPSTWRTTPQGRAGYSVFDPVANRAAVEWMLAVGRGREFVAVSRYGC